MSADGVLSGKALISNPAGLHARPAALDQDEQHNAKQNSGNNANECHIIHCNSPPFF